MRAPSITRGDLIRVVWARRDAKARRGVGMRRADGNYGSLPVTLAAKLHLRLHVRVLGDSTLAHRIEFPSGASTGLYINPRTTYQVARTRHRRLGLEA